MTQATLGMVGLGRMGGNMVRRLLRGGISCAVYDHAPEAVQALAQEGAQPAASLEELVRRVKSPRAIWLMIPASLVEGTLQQLTALLAPGDCIIDGGNSYYVDDLRRARQLEEKGIHFVDVGTSGGVLGLERGYCQMIGGEKEPVDRLRPVFAALAPARDEASQLTAPLDTAPLGFLHCGPVGAGHFVKMVHNGIEYGLMAAYAEGFNILKHANVGKEHHAGDAETTPMREPELYRYDFDLPAIAELWRRGSVIGSWLLDLTAQALARSPQLEAFAGKVSDSGEGRWTIKAAIDEAVPAPVLSAALFQRFSSRGESDYADKLLSAMRHAFGGHVEKS